MPNGMLGGGIIILSACGDECRASWFAGADDAGNDMTSFSASGDFRVPKFILTAIKMTSVQNSFHYSTTTRDRGLEITSVVVPIFRIQVLMTE
jgi:hypothetical protein